MKDNESFLSKKLWTPREKLAFYGLGPHYDEASLSKFQLPDEHIGTISNWLKREKGILTFAGNPGLGKTYLCAAIIIEWIKDPYLCRYFDIRDFLAREREVIQKGWDPAYDIRQIAETPWFLLDDLGASSMTEWQQEVIFDLINLRYHSDLPTLITTNYKKNQVSEKLGEKTLSRLMDRRNIYIDLEWIDKRQSKWEAVQ